MKPDVGREELFRLFGGLADGILTEAGHRRLREILSANAEARQLWFLHCDLEHGLARWSAARRETAAMPGFSVLPAPEPGVVPGVRRPRRWAWPLAAAAGFAILATLGSLLPLPRASASSTALTRWALTTVQGAALDRCYRVTGGADRPRQEETGPPRENQLWTRGDRFWIASRVGERSLAWGRDEAGRVWFAASPGQGVRFDADEVPERLARACELRSLQPESLLRSLLTDFDLRREPDAANGGYLVHAELKPGHEHPRYRAALLEIDQASGVLRRVEIERILPGRPQTVRLNFTLAETGLREEASYTLEGHLNDPPVILDRGAAPGQRGRALADFLGLLWGQNRGEPPPTPTR